MIAQFSGHLSYSIFKINKNVLHIKLFCNRFRSNLPVVSNLTAMNMWDATCMFFIYTSFLEFVVMNYLARSLPACFTVLVVIKKIPKTAGSLNIVVNQRFSDSAHKTEIYKTGGLTNLPCLKVHRHEILLPFFLA